MNDRHVLGCSYPWIWRRPSVTIRRHFRKVGVATGGGILVTVGIAGLVLPVVPGTALMASGLLLWSTEFKWANRILAPARRWIAKHGNKWIAKHGNKLRSRRWFRLRLRRSSTETGHGDRYSTDRRRHIGEGRLRLPPSCGRMVRLFRDLFRTCRGCLSREWRRLAIMRNRQEKPVVGGGDGI